MRPASTAAVAERRPAMNSAQEASLAEKLDAAATDPATVTVALIVPVQAEAPRRRTDQLEADGAEAG